MKAIVTLTSLNGGTESAEVVTSETDHPYNSERVHVTHYVSRVVVPATLHSISINAQFTRFL